MTEPAARPDLEDSPPDQSEMLERAEPGSELGSGDLHDMDPADARAAELARAAAPVVLHTGTYALFLTPAGGLHVTFRKAMEQDSAGVLQPIAQPEDENLPEIPPAVFRLLMESAESGKRPSPMGLLRALMAAGPPPGQDGPDMAEEQRIAEELGHETG